MKRLLGLTLSLASLAFIASPAAAKAAGPSATSAAAVEAYAAAPQWPRRRYNRRGRVVTQTRLVRSGRRVYRETYQVRYFPNGRTVTRLISRVRVR